MPNRQNMVAMGRQVTWKVAFHIKLLPHNIQKTSPIASLVAFASTLKIISVMNVQSRRGQNPPHPPPPLPIQ